jgi:DNA-binding response OmpR family regulator
MNERKKVLIIEDEVDLCLLLKTYFLRKNYGVYIAHTFNDAIPIAKACQPDIILLRTAICQNPQEDIKKL